MLDDVMYHPIRSFITVIFLAVVLQPTPPVVTADIITPILSLKRLFVEVGTSLNTVSCSVGDTVLSPNDTFQWVDSDLNPLNDSSESSNSRIFFNSSSGILTLKDAMVNDTGSYKCFYVNVTQCGDSDNITLCPNETLTYKVYIMPDYTTDGIVIGVINAVLLVIFVASLVRSAIIDRRRLRKYGQKL